MALDVDLYWSFRSPYSYLATGRLVELERTHDVQIRVKPVLPLALRKPDFFTTVNPLWPPYLLRDTMRVAEMNGIDFGWPRPDPVVQDFTTRTIATEQPYAPRLTRLGALACERGRGLASIDHVSRLIWDGQTIGWHEGSPLAEAAARAGCDLVEMEAVVAKERQRLDDVIAGNQEALEMAGHWGVPTMVFDGEPFFGQDRVDVLVWRMKQRGLRERA